MASVQWPVFKAFVDLKQISIQYVDLGDGYDLKVSSDSIILTCSIAKDGEDAVTEFEASYKANGNKTSPPQLSPFAEPTYRTKRDASDWTTCPNNSTTNIDFQLTAERYVTGGQIIFLNSQEGDYITAEVYDKDSIIPEIVRSSTCEAWPSVAKYIVKQMLRPGPAIYQTYEMSTYPLNAKVPMGLYLRLSYVSANVALSGNRKVCVNYHLTKKL